MWTHSCRRSNYLLNLLLLEILISWVLVSESCESFSAEKKLCFRDWMLWEFGGPSCLICTILWGCAVNDVLDNEGCLGSHWVFWTFLIFHWENSLGSQSDCTPSFYRFLPLSVSVSIPPEGQSNVMLTSCVTRWGFLFLWLLNFSAMDWIHNN